MCICFQDGCHHKGNEAELKRLSGGPKVDPKQGSKSPAQRCKLHVSVRVPFPSITIDLIIEKMD